MVTGYQLIVGIIVAVFVYKNLRLFIQRRTWKYGLSAGVWCIALVLTAVPSLARTVSELFGLGENLNTLIFTGFLLVFGMLFHVLQTVERLRSDITRVVQHDALREVSPQSQENKRNST